MAAAAPLPAQTPLYLLTGFLGSGKTTLLRRLLADPALADTAVIVNEFGEVGLDHLLLEKGVENAVLLDSGCLCCALDDSLAETLTGLFHRRERGEIPPFRRVVVETSGLADPAPPLQTLMTDRLVAARYAVGAVIATVEAPGLEANLGRYVELRKQVALADRLLLTKGDLVPPAEAERALARLAAVNPAAEIRAASFGAVESGWLLRPAPALRAAPEAAAPAHRHDEGEHHHDHRQGEHTHGIVSHFRACDAAVPWPRYAAAVHRVQRALGERALRVKGLLRLGGGGQPHLIQGVKHVFAPPEEIEPPGPYRCGLTFIGLDLGEDEVDAVMAELLPPQA